MTFCQRRTGALPRLPGIALASLLLAACAKPPPPPEEVRAVRTVVVAPGSTELRNTYSGEVRPRYESSLGFRVAGKIDQRKVNVGDRVRQGDVLLQLDSADLLLNESSNRANVAAQEAQFNAEKADLDRYRKLFNTGFTSKAEYDRQLARYQAAEAQLASLRAQARVSGNQTRYAQLQADADGVITAIDAEIGQVVAAGQPIIRLARSGSMEVATHVPEQAVGAIKPGAAVQVTLWTLEGREFSGHVRELASSADPATRTYALRVTVDAPPPEMQLGMTASVRIPGPELPPLIHLPLSAYIEQQGVQGVWVFDEAASLVRFRPVRLVGFDGNEALIADGLKPGERVVTAGAAMLREGQKVRLVPEAATPAKAPAAPPSVTPASGAAG